MYAAGHPPVPPGDDCLVHRIECKRAEVAELRTVIKMSGRRVIKPDAPLVVSRGAPTRQHVDILITIEIEIHGAEPLLATRRRLHAHPFTAGQVLDRHIGISGKDLDIADNRLRVAKLVFALHIGSDPECEF